MKKFIAAVAALSLIATPAFAQHRGDHRQHERHDRGGVSTSEAVAIGIGALLIGGLIGSRSNEERYRYPSRTVVVTPRQYVYEDRYYNPPRVVTRPQPRQVCQDVVQYDYYGNPYVAGRNCWYQY